MIQPRHLVLPLVLLVQSCSLFETRDPAPPSQTGLDVRQATTANDVIINLQSAIRQRSIVNYMACFADPERTGRAFVFVPSPDAQSQYGPILSDWTYQDEQQYFRNLVEASTQGSGIMELALTPIEVNSSPDSVLFTFGYQLTAVTPSSVNFPDTARGNLQFFVAPDNTGIWAISRWYDFNTSPDAITWSYFKGRFSN